MVSACLLGEKVRYDGEDNGVENDLLQRWQKQGRLLAICPEVTGGLGIPRAPAEIQGGDGKTVLAQQATILTNAGDDVTAQFRQGALATLQLAQRNGCQFAILAARSPSCGNEFIYDGSFQKALKAGVGVTAALLRDNGIQVFNQYQLQELASMLEFNNV